MKRFGVLDCPIQNWGCLLTDFVTTCLRQDETEFLGLKFHPTSTFPFTSRQEMWRRGRIFSTTQTWGIVRLWNEVLPCFLCYLLYCPVLDLDLLLCILIHKFLLSLPVTQHTKMNGHPTTNGHSPSPSSLQPLKVVIVGAGIGGLFAGISLRAAGHHVEIYESSRFATETGAAIHIPPNVNGLLRRVGLIPENHGAVDCEFVSEGLPNGDTKFRRDLRGLRHAFAYPWQLIHRIDMHNAMKLIATGEGKGKPVVIHLQSRIKEVDVEKSTITLNDGSVVSGDLILGADGVHVSSPESSKSTNLLILNSLLRAGTFSVKMSHHICQGQVLFATLFLQRISRLIRLLLTLSSVLVSSL